MAGWFLALVLLLAILLYLFLAPIYLEVDTLRQIYRIRFHRLAWLRVYSNEQSLYVEWSLIGWRKQVDLFSIEKKAGTKIRKEKTQKGFKIPIRKMYSVLRSFKLNKCRISIDTGDNAVNGVLFPCMMGLGIWTQSDLTINFLDKNEIIVEIENNFFRALCAWFFPVNNFVKQL